MNAPQQQEQKPPPEELVDGSWCRCWLTDIDLENHPEYGTSLHWVWGTVIKFADGRRRYIKFCRSSNKIPELGQESDMYIFGKQDGDGSGSMLRKILVAAKNESQVLSPQEGLGGITINSQDDVEDLKALFYKKMVLIQVKTVEKNGKVYGNFAGIKPVPWDKNRTNEQRRTSEQGAQQRRNNFRQQRSQGGKWSGNRRPQRQSQPQQEPVQDVPPDELF